MLILLLPVIEALNHLIMLIIYEIVIILLIRMHILLSPITFLLIFTNFLASHQRLITLQIEPISPLLLNPLILHYLPLFIHVVVIVILPILVKQTLIQVHHIPLLLLAHPYTHPHTLHSCPMLHFLLRTPNIGASSSSN